LDKKRAEKRRLRMSRKAKNGQKAAQKQARKWPEIGCFLIVRFLQVTDYQ